MSTRFSRRHSGKGTRWAADLGTKESVEALTQQRLRDHFRGAYAAENVIISAAGNLEHAQLRAALEKAFGSMPAAGLKQNGGPPRVIPKVIIRNKELEQSHLCLGTASYPQDHDDRYASYVMNTMFGGSMSSRLFQNIREKRGLAYSVFSASTRIATRDISLCMPAVRTRPSEKSSISSSKK